MINLKKLGPNFSNEIFECCNNSAWNIAKDVLDEYFNEDAWYEIDLRTKHLIEHADCGDVFHSLKNYNLEPYIQLFKLTSELYND